MVGERSAELVGQDCVLVMGVCGVGKSSVGQMLASALSGRFVEGDEFHSPENKQRMARGEPLTDAMRIPWLEAIAKEAKARLRDGEAVVIACSCLKSAYRDLLRKHLPRLTVVHLTGSPDLIRERMTKRADHFMPPAMLESQLAELEAPGADEALIFDIAMPREDIVSRAAEIYRRKSGDRSAPTRAAL